MKFSLYPNSSYRSLLGFILIVASTFGAVTVSFARDNSWKNGSLLLYSDTALEMNRLRSRSLNDARLGQYVIALELMFREPANAENHDAARVGFEKLIDAADDDDVGVASQFYRIRIDQLSSGELPLDQGMSDRYFELFKAHPKHFFGQMGLLKSLIFELHNDQVDDTVLQKVLRIEGKGSGLSIPQIKRSYHKSLGQFCQQNDLPQDLAFKHLKAAYDIGFSVRSTQSDLAMTVGNMALDLGQNQVAIRVFETFLETAGKFDARRAEAEAGLARARRSLLRGS